MNGNEIIRKALQDNPSDSNDEIAVDFLSAVLGSADSASTLQPIVVAAVAAHRRQLATVVERAVFYPSSKVRQITGPPPEISPEERRKKIVALLSLTFALGGGTSVSWGSATIDDHRMRIADQEKKRVALGEDISIHQWAVDRIVEAKVSCLQEIDDLDIEPLRSVA